MEERAEEQADHRPAGARVSSAMVGSSSPLQPVSWTERDTMLYALGVGAGLGDPESELHFTTENTGGITLQAIPSFITILAGSAGPPSLTSLDIGYFLHAEQSVELLRPLPPTGHGFIRNRVESVEDKGHGKGAIVRNAATLYADAQEQTIIGRSCSAIYVMQGGGFGGPRPASDSLPFPERAADYAVEYETRPEQALLYRLSGDRHRLHSDPLFASERNFPRPILHGLCTYGFTCRALIASVAIDRALRLSEMTARFVKPALPGERLITQIWRDDAAEHAVRFRTLNTAGEAVLERGTARFTA